jgi:hypothetical protein
MFKTHQKLSTFTCHFLAEYRSSCKESVVEYFMRSYPKSAMLIFFPYTAIKLCVIIIDVA